MIACWISTTQLAEDKTIQIHIPIPIDIYFAGITGIEFVASGLCETLFSFSISG